MDWIYNNSLHLTCLLTGVSLRQNIFSMIHLIFLISFPLFQTSKQHNLNGMYGQNIIFKTHFTDTHTH